MNTSDSLDIIRRALGGDMESQGISMLLKIMLLDPQPVLVSELIVLVGVTHGSIVRNLRLLGSDDDHPRGGKCAGLIQCHYDPADKRRKLVNLSPKGRLLRSILQALSTPTHPKP